MKPAPVHHKHTNRFAAWIKSNKSIYLVIAFACTLCWTSLSAQSYQDDMNAWYQGRAKGLTAENGWLNLVGLYWLDEGKNTFGSGNGVKIKFPKGTIPGEAGYFELEDGVVTQYAANGIKILVDGQAQEKATIFDSTQRRAPVSAYENLRWTIIKRSSKIGIRLRDLKSSSVSHFKGIDHYPADTSWIVTATLHSTAGLNSIAITNVLGQVNAQESPGKLHFSIGGQEYTLDALEENNKLFIIFADGTSGKTTYPAGRFLSAEKPTDGGKTILDFNKAYNPPCAFSAYATCPLPPKQNVLPVEITAGEKTYGHH
ncbi:MAG: DUF1684 domain-containing protein [Williamsia sp.]|nr:DUF1684 domain-containing protein [Williamsia sp.]